MQIESKFWECKWTVNFNGELDLFLGEFIKIVECSACAEIF